MQYSKYFSAVVRDNGVPQLSTESFRKMMNIISLEGTIAGLKKANALNAEKDKHQFSLELFRKHRQLTEITGNLPPADVMRGLFG